jgi:16S rRNA (guanine527-N7)-methyltransferase
MTTLPLPQSIAGEPRSKLEAWLDLLVTWNARIDLTAARSPEELVDLMVADAVVLAERVPRGASVVDVGAGAGAPGLALAILRPDLRVRLVEPLAKRVAFLRTVVGSIGRTDVALERGRGEDVARRGERFDVAISRATLAPPEWLALGMKLAGSVWVLLAKDAPPVKDDAKITEDTAYAWPLTHAARRAVRYEMMPSLACQ